jgi:hypothetical protein
MVCYRYISVNTLHKGDYDMMMIYNDSSIIPTQTTHNNRPDIVILDKTIKEAHSIHVAIPNGHPPHHPHHHHREAPEVYRLERRTYKIMAPEIGLHNTLSTTNNGHYSKQITQKFETALYFLKQKAVALHTCCIVRMVLAEQCISQHSSCEPAKLL